MANSGSFVKGVKKPNQGKRGPDKSSSRAKEAIARFVDGNADRLNGWLDEVYAQDGPRAAFDCVKDLLEYHVPKLGRLEHTGADGKELVIEVVRFADTTTS